SDLWDYAKKKIVEVAVKPQNSNGTRIELGFHYQGAKVVCALRSNDPSVLLKALDEWRVVLAEVLDLGNDHNLPGTEAYVYYKFRNGRWRIDEAAVMQPEFDILVFDYQLR